jgi:radical SAM superfamily enzyme YgiQ (UPF0313 family)
MRVLFSNPPWWDGRERSGRGFLLGKRQWRRGVRAGSRWPFTYLTASSPDKRRPGDYLPYPFFLGYAATYAAKMASAEIVFRDSVASAESYASFEAFLAAQHFDFVVIESATPSWEHDRDLIRQIAAKTRAKIIVTGPIASLGKKVLEETPAIAAVKGEYEKGVVKVLAGAEGVIGHDLLTVEEMNAAPFPYYDHTIAHAYEDGNPTGQIFPHAQVWASRGCPYKCIFCVWPATMTGDDPDGQGKRKVRYYSAEYMRAFLGELVAKYKYKSIYFDDDTFNLGTRHVEEMCGVMREIGLPWSAMCRADTIKMETWRLMKESGCFGVKLGFESGSQYVVDKIVNKYLDLEYAADTVRELKRLGMTVHGTFTYGLPGETPEQMRQTKAFIASLPFDTVQESGTAEIEGTPLATLREQGELKRFPGARLDEHYDRRTDGNKKAQEIARQLQES